MDMDTFGRIGRNDPWPEKLESKMVTAKWNGAVIAESNDTVVVEGNHYFPRNAVKTDVLTNSDKTTFCPWKGTASYHTIVVDGATNADAAWYYPDPKNAAQEIKDRIAFWNGVEVSD
ncbi:DUF427 domain-containing protein [Parasphingorhabdus litoris]|uniref:DUF427 domain-containing protein n=2 Tax=Parasphingorhabdus litoris TaxID=394733 RepID=A0ABN1A5L5_9SPHN